MSQSIQLRPFARADLGLIDSLKEPARQCARLLWHRGGGLFVIEATYGTRLWANRRLQVPDFYPQSPIGIVMKGALEVTESFDGGPAVRRRTTAILRDGDFFGLFEAFGNLRGFWEITAGVQRFLLSVPLGNASLLSRKGWRDVSREQLLTLKHSPRATYDYSEFVRFALHARTEASWTCRVLAFDGSKVTDSEVRNLLLTATVSQLASLARQNPPDALFPEPRPGDPAELLRVGATLDAILADHIPVLCACSPEPEEYGPFLHIRETAWRLARRGGGPGPADTGVGGPLCLWIPEYWSRLKGPVALYIDPLGRKFDMKSADKLFRVGVKGLVLRSGTTIEQLSSGGAAYSVRVTPSEGKKAVIHRLVLQHKGTRVPQSLSGVLCGLDRKDDAYAWPPHLGTGLVLQPQ